MRKTDKEILDALEVFHQYLFITLDIANPTNAANINVKIKQSDILNSVSSSLFNTRCSNVVFTPFDDFKTLFKCEYYKGTYYIKMDKWYSKIALHILPIDYDCSDKILLLKDDDVDINTFSKTDNYYDRDVDSQYRINAKYQQLKDGIVSNRVPDINDDYQTDPNLRFSKFNKDVGMFYEMVDEQWVNKPYEINYGQYLVDLNSQIKSLSKLEIAATYCYSEGQSSNVTHYIGVKDLTNQPDKRASLMEMNSDRNFSTGNKTNLIIPNNVSDDDATNINDIKSMNIGSHNIGEDYDITLKYVADSLRVFENNQKIIAEWDEI